MFRFEWDENKNKQNRMKHGIWFEEAASIFDDPCFRVFHDPEHSDQEDRFLGMGISTTPAALGSSSLFS